MKSEAAKIKIYKYSTLLGCFLILMCFSLHWYWGNLAIYLASYNRVKRDIKTKVISAWTLCLYMTAWSLSVYLVHLAQKKLGIRWTMLLGIIISESGYILGLIAVLFDKFPMELGFGALCGLGACFVHTIGLVAVLQWAGEDQCFLGGCMIAGFAFGGLVLNQALSWYINPYNETPITSGDYMPFFNQEYINDRVVQYLIIFIVSSSVICLLGLLMIRIRSPKQVADDLSNSSNKKDTEKVHVLNKEECNSERKEKQEVQYTARDILKSKSFYALTFCIANADLTFITISTYYKEFGLTRIKNDHFLSLTGTVPQFFNIIGSVIVGGVMDRFGTKRPLLTICAVMTIAFSFLYLSPLYGKWPFFLSVQVCNIFADTLYVASILALVKLFGDTDLANKLTFLFAISAITTMCIPPLLKALVLGYGWFALFSLSSASSLVAVVLILVCFPPLK